MTPEKLVEELDRVVQRARASPTSGCRRSATASTCSPPASRARSASRSRAPDLDADRSHRGRDRARGEEGARRVLGARRAAHRRALRRRRASTAPPRRATASTSPTCRASSSSAIGGENIGETVEGLQRFPINVRYPRELRDSLEGPAQPADRHRARRADPALATSRAVVDRRRSADAAQRERAPLGLGVRRHPRARPAAPSWATMQAAVAREVKLPAGYSIVVVGAVRIPRARHARG